ncbi:MAG: serine/threonine protein kinase [Clostridia bacterium]|nr:serine/threonine protein kinase [Clostridia bacterium]MBR3576831.1 serine/threonine protein kinase [Clostridia bacterium]
MKMEMVIMAAGIPSAITGLLVWWIKKKIDKQDEERQEREKNQERLMILIMQTGRATSVLSEATARAVQRIPDAHCNGDMKKALDDAKRIQTEEKDFLINKGIKHIFEE